MFPLDIKHVMASMKQTSTTPYTDELKGHMKSIVFQTQTRIKISWKICSEIAMHTPSSRTNRETAGQPVATKWTNKR